MLNQCRYKYRFKRAYLEVSLLKSLASLQSPFLKGTYVLSHGLLP